MNYIAIKKGSIGLLILLACYVVFLLLVAIVSKPQHADINFLPLSEVSISNNLDNEITPISLDPSNFNYTVIGFRAGVTRASVIVKKNNKSFVVQQGGLLENKYKLVSVDQEYATFEFNGDFFQLSTNLMLKN